MCFFRKSTITIGGSDDWLKKAVMWVSYHRRWNWRTCDCRQVKRVQQSCIRARHHRHQILELRRTTSPEVAHLPRLVRPFPAVPHVILLLTVVLLFGGTVHLPDFRNLWLTLKFFYLQIFCLMWWDDIY